MSGKCAVRETVLHKVGPAALRWYSMRNLKTRQNWMHGLISNVWLQHIIIPSE